MIGKASTDLTVEGNLDSNAVVGAPGAVAVSTTVYDSQGNAVPIVLTFTKSAANTWQVVPSATAPTTVTGASSAVTFSGTGQLLLPAGGTIALTVTTTSGATSPQTVSLDLSALTQLANTPSDLSSSTDGASAGSLTSFTVGQSGEITGSYSNGFKQPIGQIAMASFKNSGALLKAGGNLFSTSANSGTANIGVPDTNGRGQIATGFLEGSNVDLAQQFTNMIMAERGFQANSRVITTSDEILQDLVNLKH
jgi:flagellar hook protein FlgE